MKNIIIDQKTIKELDFLRKKCKLKGCLCAALTGVLLYKTREYLEHYGFIRGVIGAAETLNGLNND